MHKKPLISILLAVRDCEDWIANSISSVLDQDYKNWELLIVCNGCTDKTFEIASSFSKINQKIKTYNLEKAGKNNAYNFAFKNSNGSFLCFLAADDVLPKESLKQRLLPIQSEYDFTTIRFRTISDIDKYHDLVMPKSKHIPNFSGGSLLFSRILANTIFPIPVDLPNEDTWAQLSLRAFGNNIHLNNELYIYRIHNNNSFAYSLGFHAKKKAYFKRMEAFNLFYSKYGETKNPFINRYVKNITAALLIFKSHGIFWVLFSLNTPLKMKLVLTMYSSPFLFKLRNKLFRFLSGRINQL